MPRPGNFGERSISIGHNAGIVQTGDHAQARVLSGAITLRSPSEVDPPDSGVWGVAKAATREFVGRSSQLDELDPLGGGGAGVVTQAVHGLGGVGKTELALQYATRHRARYRVTWWVVAESADTIQAGLHTLASRLHPGILTLVTEAAAADWAIGWLQCHDDWLLVLDNVEHRHEVEPLLGQLSNGHVLITTRRDARWESITDRSLRLGVLDEDASIALLIRLSGQDDPATAAALARELGHLPLALQQAGAYLRQTQTAMGDYLRRLLDEPGQVLATVAFGDDASRSVASTWSITMSRIEEQAPLAALLMHLLSCYATDALPREVIVSGTDAAWEAEAAAALGTLASYHMIDLTKDTVTVHRLVQSATISQIVDGAGDAGATSPGAASPWPELLRLAVDILATSVPVGNPEFVLTERTRWAALSPHVAALERLCDDGPGLNLAELLLKAAVYETTQGRYRRAMDYDRRALTIIEAVRGPDHVEVAAALDHLTVSLTHLARADEAEPLQRRALAITEAALGPDHTDTAASLHNLANTLRDLGRADEAEPLQRRALAITEANLGPEHPEVANRLGSLAGTLRDLGRAAESERLFRRSLAIAESAFGSGHPLVALCLNNLATSLRDLNRPAEAEPLLRHALLIAEKTLEPDHHRVATVMNNLAGCLRELDRAGEAETMHRRALTLVENVLGSDHPEVAAVLDNLAVTLRKLDRAVEAEPLARRAVTITQAAPSLDTMAAVEQVGTLTLILHDLGKDAEAKALTRQIVGMLYPGS
ncbi:FxSxx-COOH system tetratricopeptide repeat protein [Paractinoplanes ferrugineus]|uniref:NB-ARC domain-containing protein n=2 Tax=Paractinoplanes ferrugineus TaxID=113564 RepID=A0A919J803_9ACTN|nr:hypothetical protein Afe05nite_68320 [Actinoplanes ferrugineus]